MTSPIAEHVAQQVSQLLEGMTYILIVQELVDGVVQNDLITNLDKTDTRDLMRDMLNHAD